MSEETHDLLAAARETYKSLSGTHILRSPLGDVAREIPPDMRASLDRFKRRSVIRSWLRRAFNVVFWTVVTAFVAWLFAQAVDRDPPIVSRVTIVTPHVAPRGKLKMRVEPIRLKLCAAKVTFHVYDGENGRKDVELDWQQPSGPIGPDKPFLREIVIPTDAVPGRGHLRIERQFRCPLNIFHWFWPITEATTELEFMIDPKGTR